MRTTIMCKNNIHRRTYKIDLLILNWSGIWKHQHATSFSSKVINILNKKTANRLFTLKQTSSVVKSNNVYTIQFLKGISIFSIWRSVILYIVFIIINNWINYRYTWVTNWVTVRFVIIFFHNNLFMNKNNIVFVGTIFAIYNHNNPLSIIVGLDASKNNLLHYCYLKLSNNILWMCTYSFIEYDL